MPDAQRAAAWKALNPQQRELAMSRMTAEQKATLAADLGYKGEAKNDTPKAASSPGWQDKADAKIADFTRRRSPDEIPTDLPGSVGRFDQQMESTAQNVGRRAIGGLGSMAVHPVKTAIGLYDTAKEVADYATTPADPASQRALDEREKNAPLTGRVHEFQEEYARSPREAIENLSGDLLQMYVAGKLTDIAGKPIKAGVSRLIPRMVKEPLRTTGEALTQTSPRDVAKMVRDTSEGNVAEEEKATAKNAENADKRKVDLKKHFDKTKAITDEMTAADTAASRKEAAARGVEKVDEPLRDDLAKLKESQRGIANEKYTALNKQLDTIPADTETLAQALDDAREKLKGKEVEVAKGGDEKGELVGNTPLIKKIADRIGSEQHPLTYKDVQGFYSELGSELTKGTLPGDVWYAYDSLQESIGTEMQRIANSKGLGPQLADARNSWRNLKQTFYDPKSPVAKALKATERGGTTKAFRGADRTGIEAVAKYDPALAKRLASVRDVDEIARTRTKPAPTKALPKLAPKPPEVVAQTTTLSPDTLSKMKGASVTKAAEQMRQPNRLASTFLGYDLLRNTFDALGNAADFKFGSAAKNLLKSVRDVGIRVGYSAGSGRIADLLERPDVQASLSQITPADIKEISKLTTAQQAALGKEFQPLLAAAKAKGVPVSPALSSWVAAAGMVGVAGTPKPKPVAAALKPQ